MTQYKVTFNGHQISDFDAASIEEAQDMFNSIVNAHFQDKILKFYNANPMVKQHVMNQIKDQSFKLVEIVIREIAEVSIEDLIQSVEQEQQAIEEEKTFHEEKALYEKLRDKFENEVVEEPVRGGREREEDR